MIIARYLNLVTESQYSAITGEACAGRCQSYPQYKTPAFKQGCQSWLLLASFVVESSKYLVRQFLLAFLVLGDEVVRKQQFSLLDLPPGKHICCQKMFKVLEVALH